MKNLIYIFLVLFISCSSKKDILYLNNVDFEDSYKIQTNEYLLKTDDILKIDVFFGDNQFINDFSKPGITTNSIESVQIEGYQVDSNGNINYPGIGEIYVKEMTILDLRKFITDFLIEKEQFIKLVVDIKLVNNHITVLGEVNNPGRFQFLDTNINIFEAIGFAGDMTIFGDRENVRIIRSNEGTSTVHNISLTNKDIFDSDLFQVVSGDVIIVNQNSTRVKNAGIIGNSGTLLSLLSFLLSSIIIISNAG
tara:strand:- start:3772 stop:4524 length:753 start_codon:yes stop_codon:yes gene_type:complete